MRRRDHPHVAWMIEHLVNLWLLVVVSPVALGALILHFV